MVETNGVQSRGARPAGGAADKGESKNSLAAQRIELSFSELVRQLMSAGGGAVAGGQGSLSFEIFSSSSSQQEPRAERASSESKQKDTGESVNYAEKTHSTDSDESDLRLAEDAERGYRPATQDERASASAAPAFKKNDTNTQSEQQSAAEENGDAPAKREETPVTRQAVPIAATRSGATVSVGTATKPEATANASVQTAQIIDTATSTTTAQTSTKTAQASVKALGTDAVVTAQPTVATGQAPIQTGSEAGNTAAAQSLADAVKATATPKALGRESITPTNIYTALTATAPTTPVESANIALTQGSATTDQQSLQLDSRALTAELMRSLQSKVSSSAVTTTLSDLATAKINAAVAADGNGRSIALSTFSGDNNAERTSEHRATTAQKIPQSQQTKIIDRIQQIAQDLVVQKTPTSMIVRLDPPELGEMTVKISQRADQLFARVSAESPEVEKFLQTRVHEITNAMACAGIKTDNIHVVIGKERPEAQYLPFGEGFLSGQKGQNSGDNQPRESNNQGSAQAAEFEQVEAHLAEHGLRKGTAAQNSAAGWVA